MDRIAKNKVMFPGLVRATMVKNTKKDNVGQVEKALKIGELDSWIITHGNWSCLCSSCLSFEFSYNSKDHSLGVGLKPMAN